MEFGIGPAPIHHCSCPEEFHVVVAIRPTDALPEDDKRMELTEHLGELRSRIVRCILYIVAGGTACYYLFTPIYNVLSAPMAKALAMHNRAPLVLDKYLKVGFTAPQAEILAKLERPATEWRFVIHHFPDAFFIVFKICIVAGFIASLPLIMMELYGFISPALTREEKRPLRQLHAAMSSSSPRTSESPPMPGT